MRSRARRRDRAATDSRSARTGRRRTPSRRAARRRTPARAPGPAWRRTARSAADHADQASDATYHRQVAQATHGGLHVAFDGLVSDEDQSSVGADPLLLGGADADAVLGEGAGDGVEHTGLVGDVETEQVLGTRLVDRPD